MAVKVITDSTSYIREEWLQEYGIGLVSLSVTVDGENIREVDIDHETFYHKMAQAKDIPTSSQPAIGEVYEIVEQAIQAGNDVLAIFLSSKMSGTYETGNLVKAQMLEKYPHAKIEIMDSTTNSMQLGHIVLEAAKAAKAGKTLEECAAIADDVRLHSRFLFTPEVLDYLKKGGRIGGASALLGNLLQIKPILTVAEGEANVFAKVRTKKKAVEAIVQGMYDDIKDNEFGGATVHHINCAEEGMALAKSLSEKFNMEIPIQSIGPIIGVHVGPGAIGVAYWWKSKA